MYRERGLRLCRSRSRSHRLQAVSPAGPDGGRLVLELLPAPQPLRPPRLLQPRLQQTSLLQVVHAQPSLLDVVFELLLHRYRCRHRYRYSHLTSLYYTILYRFRSRKIA